MAWDIVKMLGTFLLQFIACVVVFAGTIVLFLWAISSVLADDVQPTRPATIGDHDISFSYESTEPYKQWEPTRYQQGDPIYYGMYHCPTHNTTVRVNIEYIAGLIAEHPKYGYMFVKALLRLHAQWDKDCL